MTAKKVIPRAQAVRDVQEALDFYYSEGAEKAALAFVDGVERAYRHIGSHPSIGSYRYGHELDLPGLRCWPVTRFPHLVFYQEETEHIEVWRVLHGQRDIPDTLATALP